MVGLLLRPKVAGFCRYKLDDVQKFTWLPGRSGVYVETPSGNYFVSSGMPAGVNEYTHFRAGSNTKTSRLPPSCFSTSRDFWTSMMSSLQISRLRNSLRTDYRCIQHPNKASITIKQLLSHTPEFSTFEPGGPRDRPVPVCRQEYISSVIATDPTHQFSADELVNVIAACRYLLCPDGGYITPMRILATEYNH